MLEKELPDQSALREFHARIGWCLLALFGSLGLGLEILHAFKLQYYLGVMNETRRAMWTLAHAHGTLLAVVHLAYSATLPLLPQLAGAMGLLTSRLISLASCCMPLGFFLGGLVFLDGDPGLGILLVPVGAIALIAAATIAGFVK